MQHAFRGRHYPRHRQRRRAPRARADRRAATSSGIGTYRRTRSTPAPRPRTRSASSAAPWKAPRRAGSTCSIRSTAIASARRSTAPSSNVAAVWCRISGMRTSDGHSLWFTMKARPVVGSDGEVVRLVGTLTDVTDAKIAEERMLEDAVHDNLTGLPNRQLFIDRLGGVLAFAKTNPDIRPTVMVMDLDRFKQVNDFVGIAVGISILLTLARRLGRLLKSQDTLARLSGDQFGLILMSERDTNRIVGFAETSAKRSGRRSVQWTGNLPDRFGRHRVAGSAVQQGRGTDQRRRACDVRRQARARRPFRGLQAGDARAQDRPADARIGAAPRARSRGDHAALPADRAAGRPVDGGLRGAGALGPSEDGPPVAVGIHHDCRRDRPHQRSRAVRAGAHRAPARHLAALACAPACRCLRASTCRRANCSRTISIDDLRAVLARSGLARGTLKLELTEVRW